MKLNWQYWGWQFPLASSFFIGGTFIFFCNYSLAQIVPDRTLGNESSVVTPNVTINDVSSDRIDGGAIRGSNLFHSFQEFNVLEGQRVYFANPVGIKNIFSRVTGNNFSNILGTLGIDGAANLFLFNPNGIIFGPNARLDLKGSFLASTASSLLFGDGTQFSATNPQSSSLLTVSVPIGLQFNGSAGSILNQSRVSNSNNKVIGLEVQSGRNLALVGGDINIDGGILNAPDGRIDLGGLAVAGTIGLNDNGNLNFPDGVARSNVSITNKSIIDVQGILGGDIVINAENLEILGNSTLSAGKELFFPLGVDSSLPSFDDIRLKNKAGDIIVNVTGKITLEQSSIMNNIGVAAIITGGTGDIYIKTGSLFLEGALLGIDNYGSGPIGNIFLKANDSISLNNSSITLISGPFSKIYPGVNGRVTIEARSLFLNNGGQLKLTTGFGSTGDVNINVSDTVTFSGINTGIFQDIFSFGSTGNVNINTGSFSLTEGAQLRTSASFAITGHININARENVTLSNSTISTGFTSGMSLIGNIVIKTRSLSLIDGAQLQTINIRSIDDFAKPGKSGNIQINATDYVSIDGINSSGRPSGLFVNTNSSGEGGSITINTRAFHLSNGGILNSQTTSQSVIGLIAPFIELVPGGRGGNIVVNADTFEVTNGGQLVTTTLGSGNAGDISLNIADRITVESAKSGLFTNTERDSTGAGGNLIVNTGQMFLRQGAQASASSDGTGAAGNLQVTARSLQLDNSGLSATTTAGDRGNISIQSQNLQMRHNSNITTNASNTANGGNITIDTEVLAALEDSDIRANAVRGDGGRVNITAQGVFGTEYRAAETSESDITASSTFGRQGEVTLNTPDTDPSRGLIGLPEIPVDPTRLIAQGCPADKTSRFSVTGRGGLPLNPREALGTDGVVVNWVTLEPKGENISTSAILTSATRSTPTPSIEAQGFQRNANGDVLLTATPPTVTPYSSLSTPVSCHGR